MASKSAPLIAKGLTVALVLIDGNPPGVPCTKAQAIQWIAKVPEYFTTFLNSEAPQEAFESFFGIERDHFLIIDLKTMTLVDIIVSDPQAALDEVAPLLQ